MQRLAENPSTICPFCGAPGMSSYAACRARFDDIVGKEFADPDYFMAHRLTVDAYSLQHPEHFMVSAKSAAAHLMAMCWSMEFGPELHLPRPVKDYLDGNRAFEVIVPPPPCQRGTVTVAHVAAAPDAVSHLERARTWALSAWGAWSSSHDQARAWVADAVARDHRAHCCGLRPGYWPKPISFSQKMRGSGFGTRRALR